VAEEDAAEELTFYRIAPAEDLPEGGRLFLEFEDRSVVVFNVDGAYYAIDDVCTHDGGPLGEGRVEGYEISCPRHGARFDVRTGRVLSLPAVQSVSAYPVRAREGFLEIGFPD
jgi:3-phenylpropionate/trans-cinnamate dioxygenase ferredoxin subunit